MKRVFLISHCSILTQGLESLLDKEPELTVVGWEADLEKALRQIRALQPDVVIVEDGDPEGVRALAVLRILQWTTGTRVIGLNLTDNTIFIYEGEQRVITEVTDLVAGVRGEPVGPNSFDSSFIFLQQFRRQDRSYL